MSTSSITFPQQRAPSPAHSLSSTDDVAALLRAVERIEQRMARLESAVDKANAAAAQVAPTIAMITDTFDDLARRAADHGIDLDSRAKNLLLAMEKLTSPEALTVLRELLDRVDVLRGLLDAGVFDPGPVALVSRAGEALAATGAETPPPVGAWGALRALGDVHVQRALGFALRFAQRFGASLEPERQRQLPAAPSASASHSR